MIQQIIALLVIAYFLIKFIRQKRQRTITASEFVFWILFWVAAAAAIVFIKQLDSLVTAWGFSSGINALLYLAVLFLFYLIFKMRLQIAKLDQDLTEMNRTVSLKDKEEEL